MDCISNRDKISNYKLIGFTMSYGQQNPSTYHYMVDTRLKIKDVKKYLEQWFSWMKVMKVNESPSSEAGNHYIWGYITRKGN